ncbi:MAG TPA: ATP-binding protein [Methanoregulaceae archaeon]|nr:ATP-binding protein [Methanoregulaceae archaeon]HOP67042.1 ATP-binding protein [Methanoregulaceae archaeon]HPJ73237.1 ATP-binding protein [Methanoregulaceae archaeon]HPQ76229.1 ATP-binding protein [Methanoregulaceae archaeon]HQC11979.1 ATP-binding protein [Methanoregulaceae archaeon]
MRHALDSSRIDCKSTDQLTPLKEIIGQDRAIKALEFGLNIQEEGFNIYASGMHGTGRTSAVRKYLAQVAAQKPRGNDWIYVNNFKNPYEPNAIKLPPGTGKTFRDELASFIEEARQLIPKVFESEDYATRRDAAIRNLEQQKGELISRLNAVAQEKSFLIQTSPQGLVIIPTRNGEPIPPEEFQAMPEDVQNDYQKRREELSTEMRNTFRQLRELDQKAQEGVERLNRDVALNALGHRVAALKDKYSKIDEIQEYLDSVQNDIIDNLNQFLPEAQPPQAQAQMQHPLVQELLFRKYQVNVIVDNSGDDGAPVIFEQNPTYLNLIGKVEKEVEYGVVSTDFTMIRPGSIHKANGGYLVIMVEDLFRNPYSWDGLKTALKTGEVVTDEPGERMGFITAKGIKPEPIPLSLKVILVGTPEIYRILYMGDPDFAELFKVKADFDVTMDRNDENVKRYSNFICTLCNHYNLRHLEAPAVAKIIEYSSRLAEDQQKLSTRFSDIADTIREANFYAGKNDAWYIGEAEIQKAIDEKIYRSNLVQEKIREYINRGIILIDSEGDRVGQVNGLSVIGLGDIEFGRPSRVTASIGVGKGGIIDIEREAAMGGPLHTKGVLILSGYLANKYAQDKPLSLAARLVFEQSYSGVDGDSASSTELYALLSALSRIPIKQSIAVTGSVNQNGVVQAIGGVNEKIEGFFEICKTLGLNGDQGVMIPASNVQNLMLKEEIIEAAESGKFRIYPVKTIDEGIEVLTGVKAGEKGPDGSFEEGSINYRVDNRLREMAERFREYREGSP